MKVSFLGRVSRGKVYLFVFILLIVGGGWGSRIVDFHYLYNEFKIFSVYHPVYSFLIFFSFQIIVILLGIFPASVSVVWAGIIFGMVRGFCLAASAVLLGSIIAFYVSRTVLRESFVEEIKKHKFFSLLEKSVTRKGWKAVCLLRLSPVLPFAVTNYAIGLTGVSFSEYMVGTFFSLPSLLGYVFIGDITRGSIGLVSNDRIKMVKIAMDIIFIFSTIFLAWFVGKVVFKYLEKGS